MSDTAWEVEMKLLDLKTCSKCNEDKKSRQFIRPVSDDESPICGLCWLQMDAEELNERYT